MRSGGSSKTNTESYGSGETRARNVGRPNRQNESERKSEDANENK